MNDVHVSPEDMGALAGLPSGHERRRHVESCALCRARWLDFQSFQSAEPLPAEAHAGGARETLRDLIRKEFAPRLVTLPQRPRFRTWPTWADRGLIAAAAAVVIVASGAWWLGAKNPTGTLRGPSSSTSAPLTLRPVEWHGDSAVVLRWCKHPGAAQYEVRLYGADMMEQLRMGAGADSTFELTMQRVPAELRAESGIAWRVVAIRNGQELGVSELGTFRAR